MPTDEMLNDLLTGVGIEPEVLERLSLSISGDDRLPSCFKTTELASSSFMAAACALADYVQASEQSNKLAASVVSRINVDNRLASLWFDKSLHPLDWQLSGLWDSIAGDYACADGWIRLHTNAPHHKRAVLSVLGCDDSRDVVIAMVSEWSSDELEQAVVNAGGCAATMRSIDAWQQHPQGRAVAAEPLIHWAEHGTVEPVITKVDSARPLAGVRVLDLTRVLAGPVSTRFLAAYGADVLRIDPASWDEPGVVPEVTLGKHCAHLDLKTDSGHAHFLKLLTSADVLVHGYRPGAMAGLGLTAEFIRNHNPTLIDVSLCAYGWTGPWSQRRGFDSLVQMSSGLAHQGMLQFQSNKPHPLPVQALDHATGYLMAAAVLRSMAEKRKSGKVLSAKLSLARTAHVLQQYRQTSLTEAFAPMHNADLHPSIEITPWGEAQRVDFPISMNNVKAHWNSPACALGAFPAQWPEH